MTTDAEPTGTIAWRELLAEADDRLRRAGLDRPEVDARRIVEEAAGLEPADFHAGLDDAATRRGVARFDAMLARRAAGEPLQYVLGRWAFRTLDLKVDARVLVPRPETEVVAGLAIRAVTDRSAAAEVLVADLGTGSGAIGLAVATECPRARVLATDVSTDALAVARANLAGLGRAATRVSLHEGDWYAALPTDVRGRIDVLVANPPYVADAEELPHEVAAWEPTAALRAGPRGTEALERLVGDAPVWLAPDGVLVLEMAPHQTAAIAELAARAGFSATVHVDLAGRDRAVVATRTGRSA